MGCNGHIAGKQNDLPFHPPTVVIPAIRIPQPDGSVLFRPGKPVIIEPMIGTTEASRLLGMSRRWVEAQCDLGRFATAHKPGQQPKSRWKISRSEVLDRRQILPG
jgi:hypothetical protein